VVGRHAALKTAIDVGFGCCSALIFDVSYGFIKKLGETICFCSKRRTSLDTALNFALTFDCWTERWTRSGWVVDDDLRTTIFSVRFICGEDSKWIDVLLWRKRWLGN